MLVPGMTNVDLKLAKAGGPEFTAVQEPPLSVETKLPLSRVSANILVLVAANPKTPKSVSPFTAASQSSPPFVVE